MILVAGSLKYAHGVIEAAKGGMQKVVEATRKEDGCIDYDFAVDISDPARLIIFERWRDQQALDKHLQSPHLTAWREAAATTPPLEGGLTIWEVDEGRKL